MPWNGSGTFSRTDGTRTGSTVWDDAFNAGVKIRADDHDTHDQDIADGIGACITKNNESKPTANFLPNATASYDLGSSSVKWKDIYLSGNATVGGTLGVTGVSTFSAAATMSGASVYEANASVAAAATGADIWSGGNYVTLTGTAVTFTDFANAPQAGVVVELYCNAAHTFTNNANLVIDGGANFTAAVGDRVRVRARSTTVFELHPIKVDGTAVVGTLSSGYTVQVVKSEDGAVSTGTTIMPKDDTIPQNTEGDQYLSVSITPTSATNLLRIDVVVHGSSGVSAVNPVALFQDSTANALAASGNAGSSGTISSTNFTHWMTAGTVSSTTFKVRAGPSVAGTYTFNGEAGSRLFGGVVTSSITVTEYQV